jgi:uncharacterized Zn-binding protein involved in type VI secretion
MASSLGRIGDQYLKRCNTPVQGTGSPNVFINGRSNSRIGDKTVPYQEIVPCPKCCKTHVATVITGSSKVFTNGISAELIGKLALGITGTFPLVKGSESCFGGG